MHPAPSLRWPWPLAALLLAALALIAPVNHDEDQYVTAAWAMARGYRPFADFMYLQTPLQPWLLAPVAALSEGWTFAALRLVSAAAGFGTLALVYAAQRRLRVDAKSALIATALCGSCVPFLFGMSLARNDALPALLLALALWAGARGRTSDWGLAGLALGVAASIKISYGIPLAFGGFWLLWQSRRSRSLAATAAWGIGGLTGLLPTALTWAAYPAAFEYGVFRYAAEGAKIWYDLNGIGGRLSLWAKLRDSGVALMMGPALAALVIIVFHHSGEGQNLAALKTTGPECVVQLGSGPRRNDEEKNGGTRYRGFLVALLAAGMIAALLPTPTYRQYFLPALPPLFVLLGLAMPLRRILVVPLGLLGVASLSVYAGLAMLDAVRRGPATWRVMQQACWITEQPKLLGKIVTFSPSYAVGSGLPLDLRFATGVHVWRSGDLRSDAELATFKVTSRRTLARELDRTPPAAILTGFEGVSGVNRRIVPDAALDSWARSRGYRAVRSPYSGLLWLRQR